ncbi:unnamed protein product [Rotaria sp. Silwood2]|nr:unnamed protein product [Rotaria sp. Silwood2]CAF2630165.1 unnamed protein product [Rotaria sp. Silwood2]CAF3043211.1 unnamed protein product [Rotaria sp. Silwood2]CAF3905119.1 unnamed protein product [Rotaria sp. Silwood2]CAF4231668.1 unnamed protein product [Rotaria sp. Silwood2]
MVLLANGFLRLENMTVTYDEHVQFRCSLPKNFIRKDNIIQWKKIRTNDDDLIIAINGKVPVKFEKLYRTDLTDQFSTLELYHVKRHDSTTYICQTFETQTILCQYNLVVLIKPESPSLIINEENIQEYQTVKLTCSSLNGNPSPQYTWYRNDTLLSSLNQQVSMTDNSSIYTFNVSRFDNQVKYECQISNQALAKPLRVEQYLHVKYRPYVEILAQPSLFITNEKLIGIESNEQRLTCLINANPAVTSVYWTINSTNIISREINLYLSRLTSGQSGVYTCVVENAIGKVNRSIYLDVQYAPRVYAMESRVIVNRSNSAILRCYVDSNPSPYQIIWFKNGYEIFRQNQLSDLRIDHVERNDSGLYTCMVYNRLYNNLTRNGSSIIELIVQSRPILETTYSKIAAEIGQTITLICRVSGQPKPNIFWKRNEQIMNCDEIVDDKCFLRLFHITKKDFGSYRCIAENLLGREEWTYTIVSRGKPETPHDIRVSEITSSSFKIQFSPSFDGGGGPQRFVIEIFLHDKNTTFNATIINQTLPYNTYEYTVRDLNESSLYMFRIKSMNTYGASPWSIETSVQTMESIITSDDLPQLRIISYNTKENILHFDYLPGDERLIKINHQQLCLNIRQSTDGNIYQSIGQCLSIDNNRVKWIIKREFPFLKLSICSKKYSHICGQETEMKEDSFNRNSAPMIIGIVVITSFLILIILTLIGILCCRWRKNRLKSNADKTNKFAINGLESGVKPTISEPRLQNPYLLYSNTKSQTSQYDFSANEYQQRKVSSSFSRSCDIVDRDQPKDEMSIHDTGSAYGTANRTATIRASPHWLINNGGSSSRSGSNPSSELSCLTQNTNILFINNETNSNDTPPSISHYGFPSLSKNHPLMNGNSTLRSSSFDQQQSSSGNSTPNRMKKLFYEVVV